MSYGIPIFYYGTEALFRGSSDPFNRETFDPLGRDSRLLDQLLISHVKVLNDLRRDHQTFDMDPNFIRADANLLAFTKGSKILVIV